MLGQRDDASSQGAARNLFLPPQDEGPSSLSIEIPQLAKQARVSKESNTHWKDDYLT